MCKQFEQISLEKQAMIINAAYRVFANNNFKEASTQDIAAYANISKGLLFYYFHNKRALYFYLYDYGVKLLNDEIFQAIDKQNPDFFHRIEELSRVKLTVMKHHPDIYRFFLNVYKEDDSQLKEELQQRLYVLANEQQILLENIDMNRFRKPIDLTILCNLLVEAAVEHVRKFCLHDNLDIETILASYVAYITLLKENFYKEEYL